MRKCKERADVRPDSEKITAVFADSRKDLTRVLQFHEETGKYHQRWVKEEHMSVTSEPDGKFLFHYTPEPPTILNKPAKQAAIGLYEWMVDHGVDETVLVIGGDSTNSNTGWKGGMMTHLEELLGRKCFWVVCLLHTTELPLRHLFSSLDGKTNSRDGWTGPIGKLVSKINSMDRLDTFELMSSLEPLVELPEDILNGMSTDSKVCYKLLKALHTGKLDISLSKVLCGPLSHSRWLTLAEAVILLHMSKHNLQGEDLRKFELILKFVSQVYLPVWFEVKVKNKIVYGPHHILTILRLLRQQCPEVNEIVTPHVKSGAWFAHTEPLLLSLLASSDKEEREFAVDKLLELRGGAELGDKSRRERRTPNINMGARTLRELINWEQEVIHEPIFTCDLTSQELLNIKDEPLVVPDYPLHTQSVERAVKEVTQASSAVCGSEKRDGFIKARIAHREVMPKFISKKDMKNMFSI